MQKHEFFMNNLYLLKTAGFIVSFLFFFNSNLYSQTTEIKGSQCGTTISSGGTNIYAKSVSGANKYRFIIMYTFNAIPTQDTIIRNNNVVRLTWLSCVRYNKTYDIAVAWSNDGGASYSLHGDTCGITTPAIPTTKLTNSYCDQIISSTGTNIYCSTVPFSTEYKFKIYDSTGVFIDSVISGDRAFRLNEMTASGHPIFNFKYKVLVDTKQCGDSYTDNYGDSCYVILPPIPTQLQVGYCNDSVPTLDSKIFCESVGGTTTYRFFITDDLSSPSFSTSTDQASNYFKFSDIATGSHPIVGHEYYVWVQTEQGGNGVFGPIGDTCTIVLSVATPEITSVYRFDNGSYDASVCGGATINYFKQDTIFCESIPNAQDYEFRLTGFFTCSGTTTELLDDNNGVSTYNGVTLKDFNNGQVPSTNPLQRKSRYGKTYQIKARVKINGLWGDWGPSCTITTASSPTTKLRPAYCGATINSTNTNIYCNSVSYANSYQFEVIGAGGTVDNSASPLTKTGTLFKLDELLALSYPVVYGTTYTVRVRVETQCSGIYGSYGDACIVTLGSSQPEITSSQCGNSISQASTNLYSTSVTGATEYEFKVVGGSVDATYTTNNNPAGIGINRFQLAYINNTGSPTTTITYNTPYTISCRAKVGGSYPAFYGNPCTVTLTPAVTTLKSAYCGQNIANKGTWMYTESHSLADNYKFEVSGAGITGVEEFETASSKFNLNQLTNSGNLTVSTYNVKVNVSINGSYQGYGAACSVNLQSALNLPNTDVGIENTNENTEDDSPLYLNTSENLNNTQGSLIAYPNPFDHNFKLEYISSDDISPVQLQIHDALGREMINKSIEPKSINDKLFGNDFPNGVYIISIRQGDINLRKKMIKQFK